MSWNNKAIGVGAAGVLCLGSLIMIIADLFSGGGSKEPGRVTKFKVRHGYPGPQGPGLLVEVAVENENGFPEGTDVLVLVGHGDRKVKSRLKDYAIDNPDGPDPNDGSIASSSELQVDDPRTKGHASVYVPYAAFPDNVRSPVTIDVFVMPADGTMIAYQRFEADWLSQPLQDQLNAMAALSEAALAMIRRSHPLAREHVRSIRKQLTDFFELDETGLQVLKAYLKRTVPEAILVEDIARRLKATIEPSEHRFVIEFLCRVAYADGGIDAQEYAFLHQMCTLLGVSPRERDRVYEEFGLDFVRFYQVLELPSGATFSEVRKAYRRLASDYHPDRVQTLPKGFQEYATEKFKEIQHAYDTLRKHLDNPRR